MALNDPLWGKTSEELKLMIEFNKTQIQAEQAKIQAAHAIESAAEKELLVEQARIQTEQARIQTEQAKIQAAHAIESAAEKELLVLERKRASVHDKRARDNEEYNDTKRIKTQYEGSPCSSTSKCSSSMSHRNFYKSFVKDDIKSFNIEDVINNYDGVNEEMIKLIKSDLSLCESNNINERGVQNIFNALMPKFLSQFINSTSLKYLNTSEIRCLRSYKPDCAFIFKNVNINMSIQHEVLEDFIICLGEFKKPTSPLHNSCKADNLIRYMNDTLDAQQREKIYGFITNINTIKFFYAEKKNNQDTVYYESQLLVLCNLPKISVSSSVTGSSVREKQTIEKFNFNDETVKLFIKFFIMDPNFYQYTRLNINPNDYLHDDIFHITMKSGFGATSIVYLLQNIKSNKGAVLKISKHDDYSVYFQNEVQILKKLKKFNILNKFDLFFENIIDSSSSDKFIMFEQCLHKLTKLTLRQSKQLIDVIEYLYKCNIIHRDIRPTNIMVDVYGKRIKLIDFGFAKEFETNEIEKNLLIEGTISYGHLKFLYSFSEEEQDDSLTVTHYKYERTFDLYCAINVIICMTHREFDKKLRSAKRESTDQHGVSKVYYLWLKLKENNENYSELLKLIDNSNGSPYFNIVKDNLEKLEKLKY
ncbi:unnamed protein product [Rotaria sp. Silwood2]|nr:unnamed protein product [Rotaria sp. Silwood2]